MAKVFVSYSRRDKQWLDRVLVYLKPLDLKGAIDVWADTRIAKGGRWRDEIREAIGSAEVAVLLVSADFLASDFIRNEELPPLLEAAESGSLAILPIIIGPCRYEQTTSLSHLQTVNDTRHPLTKLSYAEQEDVFVRLSDEILSVLERPISDLRRELNREYEAIDNRFDREFDEIIKSATEAGYSQTESDIAYCRVNSQRHAMDEKITLAGC